MQNPVEKLAGLLRTTPEVLLRVEEQMNVLTGKKDIFEKIIRDNNVAIERTLVELGLKRENDAQTVYTALVNQLVEFDKQLFEMLDRPDLSKMAVVCGKLCETALKIFTPPKGFFIKQDKVVALLEKYKPDNLLAHFGYGNVAELVEKEGFSSVVAALRFAQNQEWMHKFFDEAYSGLKADDFEEREVELKILDTKWLEVAEKFLEKKYHNVSHLKEYGMIFVIPLTIDTPGETLRLFTLILHYLHEVPFYSGLFRKFSRDPDFVVKLNSLLRGDVPDGPAPENSWRIVQRYLAKDDENDFRLAERHVNPEAEHWYKAEQALNNFDPKNFARWFELDFAGDFFRDANGRDKLVSFDLIDLIMSLVKKGDIKYLYHQQEALWNKIFSEYLGREHMNRFIEENIINGFIQL